MSAPVYQVIAECCKTSQLFGDLCTNLLQRYRLSLEDFLKQAQSEISWMRVQGTATLVTGVLTGIVGIGLALTPKGAGAPSVSTADATAASLSEINGLAMNGMLDRLKQFFTQNQEMIRGGLKTAKSTLPLFGTAGQTFTQAAVTKSQTEKNLTQTTRLAPSMDVRKEIVEADLRSHQNAQSIQQAYARSRGSA